MADISIPGAAIDSRESLDDVVETMNRVQSCEHDGDPVESGGMLFCPDCRGHLGDAE